MDNDERFPVHDMKENFARSIFGMSKSDAADREICIHCKRPWREHTKTQAGVAEYTISGLCEECFDTVIGW